MNKENKLMFTLKYGEFPNCVLRENVKKNEKLKFILFNFMYDYAITYFNFYPQGTDFNLYEAAFNHGTRYSEYGLFLGQEWINFAETVDATVKDAEELFFTWAEIAEEIYG
jgi:hypothetical protein